MTVSVRGNAVGSLKVYTQQQANPVAIIRISPCEKWTEFSGNLDRISGTVPLFFVYEGEGSMDFIAFEME